MPQNWIVSVGGRTYGPFTAAQMEGFANEGRLVPHSLIARDGGPFGPAGQDPDLAPFFAAQPAPEPAPQAVPAATVEEPQSPVSQLGVPTFGRTETETASEEPSHYVIVADMKSRSISGLEEEILSLGPAYAITPQTWVLSTELSITVVRNLLVQKLGKLDLLFVIDATHDKIAWFNYSPEQEVRVRRVWSKVSPALAHTFG